MSQTSGMILTTAGRNLLSKALTGKILTFTKAQIGDGVISSGDPSSLTALISPRQDLEIQSVNTTQTGTCEIVLEISNQKLTAGYFVREYGLFARDPDTGAQVLYSYANKGDNAGYLEAFNGTDLINFTLSLITVIDTAPNVTAIINSQNAYVTLTRLNAKFLDLYAEGVTPAGFWTFSPDGDSRLRPMSLADTRNLILGTHDVAALASRVATLENNLAAVLLSQEMAELYPNYTHYIIEDFKNINQIDRFKCKITSLVTGDDSIDCDPIAGILPGSWYVLSDGITAEDVQIESVNLENGIQRIILTAPIKNNYLLDAAYLYRTTANFANQKAENSSSKTAQTWNAGTTWRGQGASEIYSVPMSFSAGTQNNASITSSGAIILGE